MTYKRLMAFLLGAVMTVEAVPAAVFAKEIEFSSKERIVAEEEEAGETEETEVAVSETTAKKEKETSETKDKAPSVTEEDKNTQKEDKEPEQTETEEPIQTEAEKPSETEPSQEPENKEDEQVTSETGVKETDAADKGTAVTDRNEETGKDSKNAAGSNEEEEAVLKDGEVIYETGERPFETDIPSKKPDNNEQLESYFRKKTEEQLGKTRPVLRKAAPSAGSRLTGNNKIAYDCFKAKAALVAKGVLTSTEFEIPISSFGLGLENKTWTAADLGVSRVTYIGTDNKKHIDEQAAQALRALVEIPIKIGPVDDALLADCPFELYWFDKTQGVRLYSYAIGAKSVGGKNCLYIAYGPTALFYVSNDYAAAPYATDVAKIGRVNTAVSKAASIVTAASGKTDYQKLVYYCNQIMSLVYYDNNAAGTGNVNYGDPWQLISVFDGNTKTNVVCEGYAKAFMYLCMLTTFKGDISCITATGDCGGGHMWNIVNMDDGKNYLVDVTNIDGRGNNTTTFFNMLFLSGYSSKSTNAYSFSSIKYTYDEESLNTYSSDQLEISNTRYLIGRSVSVSGNGNGNPSVDKTSAKPDDLVTVIPNPDKGYEVASIYVNGELIPGTTFLMTGVPAVVNVTYRQKLLKVTVTTSEGGSAKATPETGYCGDAVSLNVTPDKGYELDNITCNGTPLGGLAFKLDMDDVNVVVNFKKIMYPITVKCGDHGTATADPDNAGIDDTVTLNIVPEEGYYANSIKVNGEPVVGNTFKMLPEKVTVEIGFDLVSQAAVGDILTDGINNYKVTNNAMNGTGTVAFAGSANHAAAVSIPAVVTLRGISYKVTKIASLAFNRNPDVVSVYVGTNILVIESSAFVACPKLVKINGGLRLKTISAKAVVNCTKLSAFVITSATLSKIGTYAFYGDKSLKTVYINKTTKLTKKGVKKSLKGSSVKTVKVKKSKVKKYKKYFTKKNCGRKVKVKK